MNSRSKACEELFMTRADNKEFSDALRDAFPRLVLVSVKPWKPFVDWGYWRAAVAERNRLEAAGKKSPRVRHRMRDPTGKMPHLWSDLAVADEDQFFGWLLPEGWIPEWGKKDDFGVRQIDNPPRQRFFFSRRRFNCPERSRLREAVWFDDPPEPRDSNETIHLEGCDLTVRYSRYDDEAAAFARTVFRILGRQTIDRFVTIEPDSRRALSAASWRNRRLGMAGRRAEAWALERRHNYFFSGRIDKPASYPFTPQDIFTAEELAAYQAALPAKNEARLAAQNRHAIKVVGKFASDG